LQRKTIIRALKYCIIVLVVLTVVMFALSLHTLISGIMSAIAGGEGSGLNLNKAGPNGDWVFTFNASPRNTAFIGEKLSFSIGLVGSDAKYISVNSTSVDVAPGEQKSFSLVLNIPYEQVQKYNLNTTQSPDVSFEVKFGVSTLGNLVGFTQTLQISGGGST
jgi:hypothetical protein